MMTSRRRTSLRRCGVLVVVFFIIQGSVSIRHELETKIELQPRTWRVVLESVE